MVDSSGLIRLGRKAVLSKLADSTRSAFMSGTGVAPFFEGENCLGKTESQKDEDWDRRLPAPHHGAHRQGMNEEEKAEVARIERECSELERRMKGLSSNQQRALLESMASTQVRGGLI